jgi:CRP-like cAMP-binding protein
VKLMHVASTGRAATLGLFGPGSLIGLTDVVSGAASVTGATAFEQAVLSFIPADAFRTFLRDNPRSAIDLLKATSAELNRVMSEFCALMGRVPSSARLIQVLQDLAKTRGRESPAGIRVDLQFTEEELAQRVGCSRQWICRLLQNLQAEGFLSHKQGWIEFKASLSSF